MLLPKLDSVFALLLTTATVVSGRVITTINGALRRKAALTLEEELLPFAAALLALWRCIAGHVLSLLDATPLAWAATVVGVRGNVAD